MSITVETKGAESQVQSFSQILLDAVKSSESLNKAINAVQAGFGKVGSAIGGSKSVFAGLEQGAGKAEDSIDKLKNTIKELGFSIEKGRLKNAKGDFVALGDGAENASEDVKKLVKELEQLGYKVNSAGKITDLSGKFVKLGNDAEEAAKKQKDLADSFEKVALAAGVGFTVMSGLIGLSVKQSMELETAMAGLTKVVDFDTPDGLLNMRREFEKLSTEIPVSTKELFNMAAAGGQLGVPAEKLKEFTVLTAQMATAFDMSAEVAGDSMAKLANIFGKPIETMGEFGDMINTVSNNMPAKAREIVESLSRIGGSAKAFGLAEQEAVALAGSMISLGKAPEVASTAINSMITTLSTLDTKDQDVAQSLKAMGLNAEEFGRTIKEDGYKAIMQLLDGINQLPKDQQIGMVTDLFGKEFGDDILQLAGAPEVLEKINGLLAEQGNYIGSMAKEAANVSGTRASQTEMFANALKNASAAFGDSFKPAISAVQEALTPLLESFTKFAQDNPNLVAGIAAIATGVLGLVAGLGAVMVILPTMAAGWALLSAGMAAVSLPMLGIVAGIAAVIAIGVLLYKNLDTIEAKATEVWSAVSSKVTEVVENIKGKFGELKAKAEAIFNSLPAPARAALSAIASVFSVQFNVIKTVVSTGFALIKNTFTTAFAAIKALVRGDMEGVKQAINNGMKNAWNIVKNGVTNIASAFKDLGVKLRQAGRDAVQGFIDGVDGKIEAAVAKMRELASRAKNAVTGFLDIHSPSRVMKQIGEWVSEGFAIGIANKTPLAVKEAKKAAEAVKKAFDDELANLKRSILVNTLKLKGDPNAEFTADVVSGKYGDTKNLDKLYQTKQQALDLEQQVKAAESFNSTISDLKRQIALMGNDNPIKELAYDLQNTDKYAGYTLEQLQELESQLNALGKAKVNADFSSELKKATDELNKQQYLLNNIGDKYAELTYNLAQKGFDTSQIEHIVGITQKSDTMAQFREWDAKNRENALNADPLAKLQADFDAEMALITAFNEQKLLADEEYLQRKQDLEAQHEAQTQALKIASYESQLAIASGLAKDLLGASSRGYKAIFAMEKGMALASVLLANKKAIANAWASAPFPQNLPAVAKTAMETGAIAAAVNAIRPVIGQAHDGIMSVPKSGTWNLEKGERVLPRHTAKALDDKLDSMGSGGINITINVSSDGSSAADAQGATQTAKAMADRIKAVVLDTLRQERKQGGLLYA